MTIGIRVYDPQGFTTLDSTVKTPRPVLHGSLEITGASGLVPLTITVHDNLFVTTVVSNSTTDTTASARINNAHLEWAAYSFQLKTNGVRYPPTGTLEYTVYEY